MLKVKPLQTMCGLFKFQWQIEKLWLWQELRLGPGFTSTTPLKTVLHLVIQSCFEKQ